MTQDDFVLWAFAAVMLAPGVYMGGILLWEYLYNWNVGRESSHLDDERGLGM